MTLFWSGLGAFAAAVVLVPLMMRLARRVGFLDHPGPRKIHAEPMPYGGGLAVALAFLGAAGAAIVLGLPRLPDRTFAVVGLGSLVILALGLVDDRYKVSPRFKLLIQALVAAGVAAGGERLEVFDLGPWAGGALTVLWILAVTNAFNLLDHMDGLSAGVASIASVAFLAVALQTGQAGVAAALAPLLGACLGFLLFNFPPARIFLGDAGSLFIGFWLACLTVSFTFYAAPYPLYTYLVPLAVLAVPLFDTLGVVVIRVLRRRPLFEGDTNHLAHRLVALGMSRRRAVLAVYALTLYAGLSAVLLYQVRQEGAWIVLALLVLTFGLMTLLETAGRRSETA
ncbi:MAG TPA: MraY family glycosyltransferase [Planctomycetota bacterium]|nr:MraY family glycosyltransferase [Planctomycetota bacterium]